MPQSLYNVRQECSGVVESMNPLLEHVAGKVHSCRRGHGCRPAHIYKKTRSRPDVADRYGREMVGSTDAPRLIEQVDRWVPMCGWICHRATYNYSYAHGQTMHTWVHSSVVRAADCRSAGPWLKSGCAL